MTRQVSSSTSSQIQTDNNLLHKGMPSTNSEAVKVTPVAQACFSEKGGFFGHMREGLELCKGNDQLKGRIHHQSTQFNEQSVEIACLKRVLQSQQATMGSQDRIIVRDEKITKKDTAARKQSTQEQREKLATLEASKTESNGALTLSEPNVNRFHIYILSWINRLLEVFFKRNQLEETHNLLQARLNEGESVLKGQHQKIQSMRQEIANNFLLIEDSEKQIEEIKGMRRARRQSLRDAHQDFREIAKCTENRNKEIDQMRTQIDQQRRSSRTDLEQLLAFIFIGVTPKEEQSINHGERKIDMRWQKEIQQQHEETKQLIGNFGSEIEDVRKGLESVKGEIIEEDKLMQKERSY